MEKLKAIAKAKRNIKKDAKIIATSSGRITTPAVARKEKQAVLKEIAGENKRKAHGLFSGIGSVIGGVFGGPAGASVGGMAGNAFGELLGFGSYHVNGNTLLTDNGPPMVNGTSGNTNIVHREYIGDVTAVGPSAFTNIYNEYINPGNKNIFPWLSIVSAGYEQYRFKGLVFEYKSTSGNSVGSTTTTLPTVMMATNYDVYDNVFLDKQSMLAYEFSTDCVSCSNAIHPIECKPKDETIDMRYLRQPTSSTSGDQRLYDVGRFQLATVGSQASCTIGELWVSYHVELVRPKLEQPLGSGNSMIDYFNSTGVASATAFGTIASAVVSATVDNSRYAFTTTGSFQFQTSTIRQGMPAGRYFISLYGTAGTSWTSGGAITITQGTGASLVQFTMAGSVTENTATGAGSTQSVWSTWIVVDWVPSATALVGTSSINLPAPVLVGANTSVNVIIVQLSSSLSLSKSLPAMLTKEEIASHAARDEYEKLSRMLEYRIRKLDLANMI